MEIQTCISNPKLSFNLKGNSHLPAQNLSLNCGSSVDGGGENRANYDGYSIAETEIIVLND